MRHPFPPPPRIDSSVSALPTADGTSGGRNPALLPETSGAVGHTLLPWWPELRAALPGLGTVCSVSRNEHAILGGTEIYPPAEAPAGNGAPVHYAVNFPEWEEGWFYREWLDGRWLHGFEFRDLIGLGFHKIMLLEESDRHFASLLSRAFEQDELPVLRVTEAIKTNHIDGACCPHCEARYAREIHQHSAALQQFIRDAVSGEKTLRVILPHPGLTTVRRFVPQSCGMQGLWLAVKGGSASLFLRPSGVDRIGFSRLHTSDRGPCRTATLHNGCGEIIATLIVEENSGSAALPGS